TRLRVRLRAAFPRLVDGEANPPLAGVRTLDLSRLRALAVGPLGCRLGLVLAVGARRLGAPGGGLALGRRAGAARVRGLAARPGATTHRVPALLAAGDRADRRAARRRDLPEHPAAAASARSLDGQLRPGA